MSIRAKRVIIVLVVFALLAGLFFIITVRSTQQKEHRQIEVQLYGYRLDNKMIMQDTNGKLWEIPYNDRITADDIVLLDVTGYKVNKVYIQIIEANTEPETLGEGHG